MTISCPQCNTKYELPEMNAGDDGRKMQCVRCHYVWPIHKKGGTGTETSKKARRIVVRPKVSLSADDGPKSTHPPLAPVGSRQAETVDQDSAQNWHLSILAAAVAIGLSLSAGFFMRSEIVSVVPSLQSLYKLVGIDVKQHGLEFADVTSRAERDENGATLVVEGLIKNVSEKPVMVPRVRVAIRSTDKEEISSWLFQPEKKQLSSGEEFRFSTTMDNPPKSTRSIQLRFADFSGAELN